MATSKRINVDELPDLNGSNNNSLTVKTVNVDELPEVKKKVGSSDNSINLSTQTSDFANGQVPKGLIEKGNIDLTKQPSVHNPETGGNSTVWSISFGTDKGEVLVSRVTPDGKILSPKEALDYYKKTGKHLGIFKTADDATAYSEQLHDDYAQGKFGKPAQVSDFANATKPTGTISSQDVLNAQQHQNVSTEQKNVSDYGEQLSKAAIEAPEKTKQEAANNTAALYFKNNPQLVPDNESFMLKNADTKNRGYTYSLKNLPHTTAFQQKASQIKNDLDNGKLITYKSDNGEVRAAYPMTGVKNLKENFKQAWNASGEADKVLKMNDDEFQQYAMTSKPDDEYLPTKPNTESLSGQAGQALPVALKGTVAGGAGYVLSMGAPETGGLSLEGLPALAAWAATAPDMAKTQAAQGKIKAYRDAISQGKSPQDAMDIANKMSQINYAEGMALGTALTALPSFVPKGASNGFLKSYASHIATLPYGAGAQGLLAGELSNLKNEYASHIGLDVSEADKNKEFNDNFNSMATVALAFGALHGLVPSDGATKAQAKNVISKIPTEDLNKVQDAMVQSGQLTQDQVNEANKGLQDFNNAGKKIIPTGNDEKDAVIKGLIEKKNSLAEKKQNVDESFHSEIDAQIEDINNRINLAKNSSDPLKYAEQDNLTGQTHFNPKGFDELTPSEKNTIAVPTDFGKASVESKGENNFTPAVEVNNQPIKVEGTFTDKAKAQDAADNALKEIYYNNKLSPLQKPESKNELPTTTNTETQGEEKTEKPIIQNNEAGNSGNGLEQTGKESPTEKSNGEDIQLQFKEQPIEVNVKPDVAQEASDMKQAENAKAEQILRDQRNDEINKQQAEGEPTPIEQTPIINSKGEADKLQEAIDKTRKGGISDNEYISAIQKANKLRDEAKEITGDNPKRYELKDKADEIENEATSKIAPFEKIVDTEDEMLNTKSKKFNETKCRELSKEHQKKYGGEYKEIEVTNQDGSKVKHAIVIHNNYVYEPQSDALIKKNVFDDFFNTNISETEPQKTNSKGEQYQVENKNQTTELKQNIPATNEDEVGDSGDGNPPTNESGSVADNGNEDGWTAIRKEKLKDIEGIKKVFEKETGKKWSDIQQSALEDVQKQYPEKDLYESVKAKTESIAAKYDNKEDYNPTAKDLAVIQEFKRQTEKKISKLKDGFNSDEDIVRNAAILEAENYQNDLVNIGKALHTREAGTAFGFRQSESKADENYGLQIRRMELMKANGGEKLSDADMKWTEEKWNQEKEILRKQQEVRENAMKEEFDKRLQDLKNEYEQKLKQASKATSKSSSNKIRNFADKIRNSETLDKLGLGGSVIKDADIQGVSFNVKEALAKTLEYIADGMDKAQAIVKALKELGGEVSDEFKDLVDRAILKATIPDREAALDSIKELAEKDKATTITKEMVSKGLIKNFVESHIGEVEQKELLDEASKNLKKILPDTDRQELVSAYLKEGDFKPDTKQSLNENINSARRQLVRIAKRLNEKSIDELQKEKLQQEKDATLASIKSFEQKIKSGEYEESKPPVALKKADAELIRLNKQKSDIEHEFRKKQNELAENKKSNIERVADTARSAYVAALIGAPKTFAKIAATAIMRPLSEATTKLTMGKAFDSFFPAISRAAKRGGESSSWRSVQKGFQAYFRQMGEKKLNDLYDKANTEYEKAAQAYADAKTNGASEKELVSLKNNMNNKLVKSVGNFIYKFIGGSSLKDAAQALIHRTNEIEKQFDAVQDESFKEGNWLDKTNYILNFIGRSHSALKTFSGRFSFAAGFMARLEAAARDGENINGDRVLEIAHESYLDWERGKYQQDNYISDKWNQVLGSIDKGLSKHPEWDKYNKATKALLKSEVAITRVPVNILHEAVMEYTVGAFRAVNMALKAYKRAKGQAVEEGFSKADEAAFKERIKGIVSSMDEKQAATIARAFRKGSLGIGLYTFFAIAGMMKFGSYPHKYQQKEKDTDQLKPDELNAGQVQVGDTKLGEVPSAMISHTPALWPTFMGLGMSYIYNMERNRPRKPKTPTEAAWKSLYTHLDIIQSQIPQSQIINPLQIITSGGKAAEKRLSDWGLIDEEAKPSKSTSNERTHRTQTHSRVERSHR